MSKPGYALFDTAIGRCGIAWGERGLVGVQLPEADVAATRSRLAARFPDAQELTPSPLVRKAIARIVALLDGKKSDLSSIVLDDERVPAFHRRVYEVARSIAPGTTLTYGEVAKRLGSPGASRAVGQALGRNPFAIVVPCHRVLAANGKPGGFTANGGVDTKLAMLAIEQATKPVAKPPSKPTAAGYDVAAAVAHLRESDPKLARLIDAVGPCTMTVDELPSVFYALARSIVYQQLTGKAAATIFGRVCALFPRSNLTPEKLASITDEQLRGAGLSRNKTLALRDLAARALSGALPSMAEARKMDDEQLIERFVEVRGIGRWTVEMFLMFRLGRPDVLPVGDYGVKKGFQLTYKKRALPTPKELEAHGTKWKPYRTIASWYMWRALELPKR